MQTYIRTLAFLQPNRTHFVRCSSPTNLSRPSSSSAVNGDDPSPWITKWNRQQLIQFLRERNISFSRQNKTEMFSKLESIVRSMKIPELKEELRTRNLMVGGTKEAVVQRFLEYGMVDPQSQTPEEQVIPEELEASEEPEESGEVENLDQNQEAVINEIKEEYSISVESEEPNVDLEIAEENQNELASEEHPQNGAQEAEAHHQEGLDQGLEEIHHGEEEAPLEALDDKEIQNDQIGIGEDTILMEALGSEVSDDLGEPVGKTTYPIGESDFGKLVSVNGVSKHFYWDKSLFIRDLLDSPSTVSLVVRPHRFEKTTILKMTDYFCNHRRNSRQNSLFNGLNILDQPHEKYQGKFSVISLSFKSCRFESWEQMKSGLITVLSDCYKDHSYLLDKFVNKRDKMQFESVMNREPSETFQSALKHLTHFVRDITQLPVILLIDEYDTPLNEAHLRGFWAEATSFLSSTIGSALKDNEAITKALLTGVLPITTSGYLSESNNIKTYTMNDSLYSTSFGVTASDAKKTLSNLDLEDLAPSFMRMYDGYSVGKGSTDTVINTWSLVNFLNDTELRPYWNESSASMKLMERLLWNSSSDVKETILGLLRPGNVAPEERSGINLPSVTVPILRDVSYDRLDRNLDPSIWSQLYYYGYLTSSSQSNSLSNHGREMNVRIPNMEIRSLYECVVFGFFSQTALLDSTLTNLTNPSNKDIFGHKLKSLYAHCMSLKGFRTPTNFVHALAMAIQLKCEDLRVEFSASNMDRDSTHIRTFCVSTKNNSRQIAMNFVVKDELSHSVTYSGKKVLDQAIHNGVMDDLVGSRVHVYGIALGHSTLDIEDSNFVSQ